MRAPHLTISKSKEGKDYARFVEKRTSKSPGTSDSTKLATGDKGSTKRAREARITAKFDDERALRIAHKRSL